MKKLFIQEGCVITYKNGPQKPNLVVIIKGLYASLPTDYIHNEFHHKLRVRKCTNRNFSN